VLSAWVLIVMAESAHGIARRLLLEPVVGELAARQIGVLTGSAIIFAIACLCIRWIGARTVGQQFRTGLAWTALMLAFEIAFGTALGYGWQRILSDYDPARGGFLIAGLAFMACAPALAARARKIR
jgi:hypothetical protein